MKTRALCATVFAICGSLGCAANALDEGALGAAGGPPEPIATDTTQLELAAPAPPIPTFAQLRSPEDPNSPNPVLPGDQWVCALGRMTGSMQSGDVVVDVNTNWYVNGRSSPGAQRMNAGANCYPLNAFIGGPAKWLSAPMRKEITAPRRGCEFYFHDNAWLGDAATFLTRIMGGMYGGAELVDIDQSNDPWSPSTFGPRTCQGTLSMSVRSLFIGNPGTGKQPRFKGPGGVGDATTAGEYIVDRTLTTMARTDEAFCYFTMINGAFAGYGELAEIVPMRDVWNNEVWGLRTVSQQGLLTARARCYMLDQS